MKKPPAKPEYNVTLTFENERDATAFAAKVMSRTPPRGTRRAYRVAEVYPKTSKEREG